MQVDQSEEFLQLLHENSRQIYSHIYVLVLNKTDADDIIQETNLVLWREFCYFKLGTNFLAWAKTIATNRVLAWKTRCKRDRHVFSTEFINVVVQETDDHMKRLSARSEILTKCLEKLPKHSRELISKRYDKQFDIETLANSMNRTTGSIYKTLSRIRKTLHDCVTSFMVNGYYDREH